MVDWDSNKLVHQHTPGVGGLHQGEQHPHQQLVPGNIILGKIYYNWIRVKSVEKGPIFLSTISKRRNHAWSFFCPLYFYEMMRSPIADGVNYELKQINWLRYQIIIKCQLRTKYSDWNWYNFDLDNQICNTFHKTMPGASMTKYSSHQYRKRVLALNVFREKNIYPPSFCTIEPVNLSQ